MPKKRSKTVIEDLVDLVEAVNEWDSAASDDRSYAVVGATLLEDALEQYIKSRMVQDEAVVRTLFDVFAPLSTFSGKIRVAYSFGLLRKHSHDDLNNIRDIRNIFAHNLYSPDGSKQRLSFRSRPIAQHCKRLRAPDTFKPPGRDDRPLRDSKLRFGRAVTVLVSDLAVRAQEISEPTKHDAL